ncbi:hypothetical protein PR202_ga20286 [Eleusine coracana subsp. coracana]|uniref:Uncharacterized protein n=1 Tax=Eleusine coracana subsp. coracana TaxID=191504 RepID=A0AAV5CY22_ELECO|nr:hypothetical protein PR202_ga20286 [Eleusine coracana subsp. coracana]
MGTSRKAQTLSFIFWNPSRFHGVFSQCLPFLLFLDTPSPSFWLVLEKIVNVFLQTLEGWAYTGYMGL